MSSQITPKTFRSRVNRGIQLGRTIGFPTLNLDAQILPKRLKKGVYQAEVTVAEQKYQGVLFYGPKKTFNQIEIVLEIHLFNFDREIYHQPVTFSLGKFLRPPLKFDSIQALKNQISLDIANAKNY